MNVEESFMTEIVNAIKVAGGSVENVWLDAVDFSVGEKRYSLQIEERK